MRTIFLFIVLCLVIILCGADYARRYPTNTPLGVMGLVNAPAEPNSPCSAGQVAYNGLYLFVCESSNTWLRDSIATWAKTRYGVIYDGLPVNFEGLDVLF